MNIKKSIQLIRRFFQWTLLCLLIVSAVYVVIGRALIGRVNSYEQELAGFLSEQLSTPVTIKSLGGSWHYLDPQLTVAELRIGEPDKPDLIVKDLAIRLDFLRSVFRFTPTIKELLLGSVELTVIRSEDSVWSVQGLPKAENSSGLDTLLDVLEYISFLKLEEMDIRLLTGGEIYNVDLQGARSFEISRFRDGQYLSSVFRWHRLSDGDKYQEAYLGGKYDGDPRDLDNFFSDIYLKLPELEVSDFYSSISRGSYELTQFSIAGEYWLKSEDGVVNILGESVIPSVEVVNHKSAITLTSSSTQLFRLTHGDESWQLVLRELDLLIQGQELIFPQIELTWSDQSLIGGYTPGINLGPLLETMQAIAEKAKLPVGEAKSILAKVDPKGFVSDINFYLDFSGDKPQLKVIGYLLEGGISPFRGIPGVTNLEGFISFGTSGGYLNVHSTNLELNFNEMFGLPWHFDTASAKVDFSYTPETTTISSGTIALAKGPMHARGKLQINLPRERNDHTWGLSVGIVDGGMEDVEQFLPNSLSPELKRWLNRSLVSGILPESGLLFHGSLFRDAPKVTKVYQMYYEAEQAVLDYNPGWPRVENLDGVVYIHNLGVTVGVSKGTMFDSQLSRGVVTVPMSSRKPATKVKIDASLLGTLKDGIRFLNETPVKEKINNLAEDWVGEGQISTRGLIEIPIGKGRNKLRTDITVSMSENKLYMPKYNLHVNKLRGRFNYNETKGLSSSKLDAEVLGQSVVASMSTRTRAGKSKLDLNIRGSVGIKELYKWSKQPLLLMADGQFKYNLDLFVPYGGSGKEPPTLRALSNLKGVSVRLPEPFLKEKNTETKLVYEQIFSLPQQRVNIEYGNQARVGFMTKDGKMVRGAAHFGSDKFLKMPAEGIQVKGRIHEVDYAEWEEALGFLDSKIESSLEGELIDNLDYIDIDIGTLFAFGVKMKDVGSRITRGLEAWDVHLNSEMLEGNFVIPDDESVAVRVNLEYLRFKSEDADDGQDPLKDFNPSESLNVDFSSNEISSGEENYGSWAFRFRPTTYGAELIDINAQTRGLQVRDGSKLTWKHKDGVHESQFSGLVVAPDLASALAQWKIPSSIEGSDFKISSDVYWAGSPVMVSIDKLKGQIQLRAGEGRFVQASQAGALKIFGIFDFASIARRLKFDFSDIVKKGYSFDKIKGTAQLNEGVVTVLDSVIIEGSSSIFTLGGSINLVTGEMDNDMIVTLPVNRNLPWAAGITAITSGPLIGGIVILIRNIFGDQIDQLSSAKYKISGTIDEPEIELVNIFNNTIREAPKAQEGLTTSELKP